MLIGRTRKGIEELEPSIRLTKDKYFFLSDLCMNFLIDNNIKELPVSLNKIIKNNNWKTIPYSKLIELNIERYNNLIEKNLGFVELRTNNYFIYYDDEREVEVQRFTIAHEIGHIVLNHFKIFTGSREQEANMFASRLLMPMCVLYECDVNDSLEISKLCKVSNVSAEFRYARLVILKQRNKFYKNNTERRMKDNFKSFIAKVLTEKK